VTRRAFLEKYFVRFAVSLTLVGLIVYTVYHVFGTSSGSLLTTPARRITDMAIIDGEGYLFREEKVLTVSSPGIIRDLAQSGSKVSRGGALVQVYQGYDTEVLASTQLALERLEGMIAVLEESRVADGTTLAKAEAYRKDAVAAYRTICASSARGETSGIAALAERMLVLLNRHASLTDPEFDIDAMQKELVAERDALLLGDGKTIYNEEQSGCFYRYDAVDGYETLFTPETLQALTAEGFAELKEAQPITPQGFAVGKTVHGNRWYLAVGFDGDAAEFVAEQGAYTFTFPENRDKEIGMYCQRIVEADDGGIVAVFASDEVPTDFVWKRSQTVEITVGSTTGYYVPDAALHETDAGTGVYVLDGSTVYFRRVEILYRGDGYSIAAEQGDRGDYLALNDLMVTSGEDLYDGRVFQ
jgi:hypothetical protein